MCSITVKTPFRKSAFHSLSHGFTVLPFYFRSYLNNKIKLKKCLEVNQGGHVKWKLYLSSLGFVERMVH